MQINEFVKVFETIFEDVEKLKIEPTCEFKQLSYWDSLAVLNCIAIIEENYGVLLSANDIKGSKTVEDLYSIVHQKKGH
jgi:acyl carrier protein